MSPGVRKSHHVVIAGSLPREFDANLPDSIAVAHKKLPLRSNHVFVQDKHQAAGRVSSRNSALRASVTASAMAARETEPRHSHTMSSHGMPRATWSNTWR